jgi:hypothetical protein
MEVGMLRITRHLVVTSVVLAIAGVALASCGTAQAGTTTPAATPTLTLDPTTQAYVSVLRTYYVPFSKSGGQEIYWCEERYAVDSKSQRPQDMVTCQPMELSARDDAQAALTHLGATPPPARWQQADTELKQALQLMIPYYTARISAIDANSTTQFEAAYTDLANQPSPMFCDAIRQLNAPPSPFAPPLEVPGACGEMG